MSEILTIGYAESGALDRIDAFLCENHTGALIDIRLSPRSRWHLAFTRSVLASKYPEQYIWMPEFGNLNYKPEDRKKGIEIAAPETGLAHILHLLNDPLCRHPLMFMCACKDYETCHRKVVYELVRDALLKAGQMQCHCCDQFVPAECGTWTEPGESDKRYWLCFDCIK